MAMTRGQLKKVKKQAKWLFSHLRGEFNDLPGAITWYTEWAKNGQHIHGWGDDTLRVMASHCSDILEDKLPNLLDPSYMQTKFGSDIYWSL